MFIKKGMRLRGFCGVLNMLGGVCVSWWRGVIEGRSIVRLVV